MSPRPFEPAGTVRLWDTRSSVPLHELLGRLLPPTLRVAIDTSPPIKPDARPDTRPAAEAAPISTSPVA